MAGTQMRFSHGEEAEAVCVAAQYITHWTFIYKLLPSNHIPATIQCPLTGKVVSHPLTPFLMMVMAMSLTISHLEVRDHKVHTSLSHS